MFFVPIFFSFQSGRRNEILNLELELAHRRRVVIGLLIFLAPLARAAFAGEPTVNCRYRWPGAASLILSGSLDSALLSHVPSILHINDPIVERAAAIVVKAFASSFVFFYLFFLARNLTIPRTRGNGHRERALLPFFPDVYIYISFPCSLSYIYTTTRKSPRSFSRGRGGVIFSSRFGERAECLTIARTRTTGRVLFRRCFLCFHVSRVSPRDLLLSIREVVLVHEPTSLAPVSFVRERPPQVESRADSANRRIPLRPEGARSRHSDGAGER